LTYYQVFSTVLDGKLMEIFTIYAIVIRAYV
jgi:hypothetical protein